MTIKQILQTIEEGNSLKIIAQAYTEIASIRLKKIRSEVERNRLFFADISAVFRTVKSVAAQKGINPPAKTRKAVSIVLTSNYRFYGNINIDLINFFKVKSATLPCDRIAVGKTGIELLKGSGYIHPYKTFLLKEDLPSLMELKQLATFIKDYQQVLVFHSQFQSVLTQKPVLKDITETPLLQHAPAPTSKYHPPNDFIFEPEIGKMLDFFESQIKILLMEQTFLESELSRTASRLVAMDQAQSNAQDFIKKQQILLSAANRSLQNIRLLDTYAAIYNYRGKEYETL